jgi:transcriptional regulator with XRE-family HTH domain
VVDLIRAKEFGSKIKALRMANKMGLRELARATDISSTYLSYIEQGLHGPPSPEKVKRLAIALGENPYRLLNIAGHIDPEVEAWAKQSQEAIGNTVSSATSSGWSNASIILFTFVYALTMINSLVVEDTNDNEASDDDELSFLNTPPSEIVKQLKDNVSDMKIEDQKRLASLFAESGKLWLADLNTIKKR